MLVVGAGTMGQQISLQCATHGLDVTLYDVFEAALQRAESGLKSLAAEMAADLGKSSAEVDEILNRIQYSNDAASAAANADLLSESVPEDVWLKRKVFAEFNRLCPPHTIFTSNSSTLLPKEIAKQSGRPERFAALHFHPNVWYSNVVDVLPDKAAPPELAETLKQFSVRIGQIPILFAKDSRGFIVNRFLVGIFRQALDMAASGTAPLEEIDAAFIGVFKTENGPFGIMDIVGLDTMLSINEFWSKRLLQIPKLDPVFRRNLRFLRSYVDQGHLGRKTGKGFYEYPTKTAQGLNPLSRSQLHGQQDL